MCLHAGSVCSVCLCFVVAGETRTRTHTMQYIHPTGARDGSIVVWDLSGLLRRMQQQQQGVAGEEDDEEERQEDGKGLTALIRVQARITGACFCFV
jgi:hypothetical protein